MVDNTIRNYEVSIWSLQDDFISVLKASNIENKGQIQDAKMNLKDDGTSEFSFSLPMYIYDGDTRIENPNWFNKINGNLIANLRKIKVIFNKDTADEGVYEFLITVVTERHDAGELYCDVKCEGLAFHELGKIGYKIELNQDSFLDEWNEWATEKYEDEDEHRRREPKNNINYWCDKIFKGTNWRYSIYMDWAAYDGYITLRYKFPSSRVNLAIVNVSTTWSGDTLGDLELSYSDLTPAEKAEVDALRENLGLRLNTKVYEDEYVSSWTNSGGNLTPKKTESKREKFRLLDVKESNIYNITQSIAETFGVFCRYEYHYDENYHIIDREVIFYNNFIKEASGELALSYPHSTNHIEREMDGSDLITKMYVKTLNDDATDSGIATIVDADANKSGEDYILNFDYLYSIGAISQEQYDDVSAYEAKLHDLNTQMLPLESQLIYLQNELVDVEAAKTIAKNAMSLDDERISANDALLNALTDGTGVLHVNNLQPDICYLLENTPKNGTYYLTIRQAGIIQDTIHIYKTHDLKHDKALADEIKDYKCEIDEAGNLTGKITNLSRPENQSYVYVIYDYNPKLYYENIKKMWVTRKQRDTTEYEVKLKRSQELDGKKDTNGNRLRDGLIQTTEKSLENLRAQKRKAIAEFERMMGPALREGTWQPEDDYSNYGDKYSESFNLTNTTIFGNTLMSPGWDSEIFDDELKNYYESDITQAKTYYPCVNLTSYISRFTDAQIKAKVGEDLSLNSLSFIFQDMRNGGTENPSYFKYLPIGSLSQLTFIREKGTTTAIPVLMLTGMDSIQTDVNLTDPTAHSRIGYLKTTVSGGSVTNEVKDIVSPSEISWISAAQLSQYEVVYPRMRIDTMNLKVSDTELSVLLNKSLLHNYNDYYVTTRSDPLDNGYILRYYITIRPEVIFRSGDIKGLYIINYAIANTALIMYLDALQVLRENSYPKVSYTVDSSLMNSQFTHIAYKGLNRIVHINDSELKFENVQGYISELELNLDEPWEDTITITNYKTKFEDLFSSIVAQTEEMKRNSQVIGHAANLFTASGQLKSDVIQSVFRREDLDYAFNHGTLTIDEENGIWGTSDSGVVAFRGGGIFTANEKDEDGDWLWNTGILPSGINASLITSGQLDTNLIRIYAGDNLKFQMNGDGLFAYKSWLEDNPETGSVADTTRQNEYLNNRLNPGQYVVHNSEGLFLVAKAGAKVLNEDRTDYLTLGQDINRVSISWDGFTIRNWKNEKVFFADDQGNLTLTGNLRAKSLTIINGDDESDINDFVNGKVNGSAEGLRQEFKVADGVVKSTIEGMITETKEDFAAQLKEQVDNLNVDIDKVQKQADSGIITWFYEGKPTLQNLPAIEWDDDDKKALHVGDLYFNKKDGTAFRWEKGEKGYTWTQIQDAGIIDALNKAKNAQDTADNKRRIFYNPKPSDDHYPPRSDELPTPPYDVGDIWIQGKIEGIEEGGILRAKTKREEGDTPSIDDWAEAATYTSAYKFSEFKQTVDGFRMSVGKTVGGVAKDTELQYAVSDSRTVPPVESSPSWSTEKPTVSERGKFVWQRIKSTVITEMGNPPKTTEKYSTPVCISGFDGTDAFSSAIIYLYKRSATPITSVGITGTVTYHFDTKVVDDASGMNGWSSNLSKVKGEGDLYITAATASSVNDSDTIESNEWSTPVLFSKNGTDGKPGSAGSNGTNGTNGLNSATIFLYCRQSTPPSKPSAKVEYTFSNGAIRVITGTLSSWGRTVPEFDSYGNRSPCYVTQATAISSNETDVIESNEWATPTILTKDGINGAKGDAGAPGAPGAQGPQGTPGKDGQARPYEVHTYYKYSTMSIDRLDTVKENAKNQYYTYFTNSGWSRDSIPSVTDTTKFFYVFTRYEYQDHKDPPYLVTDGPRIDLLGQTRKTVVDVQTTYNSITQSVQDITDLGGGKYQDLSSFFQQTAEAIKLMVSKNKQTSQLEINSNLIALVSNGVGFRIESLAPSGRGAYLTLEDTSNFIRLGLLTGGHIEMYQTSTKRVEGYFSWTKIISRGIHVTRGSSGYTTNIRFYDSRYDELAKPICISFNSNGGVSIGKEVETYGGNFEVGLATTFDTNVTFNSTSTINFNNATVKGLNTGSGRIVGRRFVTVGSASASAGEHMVPFDKISGANSYYVTGVVAWNGNGHPAAGSSNFKCEISTYTSSQMKLNVYLAANSQIVFSIIGVS